MRNSKNNDSEIFLGIFVFAMFASFFAAWCTHVVVCLATQAWGFLIAGAIMFPIAIIHGFSIWFGFF